MDTQTEQLDQHEKDRIAAAHVRRAIAGLDPLTDSEIFAMIATN